MVATYTPYSNAAPFTEGGTIPLGLSGTDAERVKSYDLYEQMYWNHPETYKLLQRGEDEAPIYLPTPKQIIESTHRFLAVNWDYFVDPGYGTEPDRLELERLLRKLFRREQMWTKFSAQKRYGLIRGDAVWHVTADPNKDEGSRISLTDIHPGRYFPISDPNNPDKVIGVHLVDMTVHPQDPNKQVTRRQTYRKGGSDGKLVGITTELTLWENGKWDDRKLKPENLKKISTIVPETPLNPLIDSIPVYHIRNTWESGHGFGSSQIRGIETVIAAANQGESDLSLAFAIGGLGMFWTDAAPPVDANNQPTDWDLGILRVAEVPNGRQMGRLGGVDNGDSALANVKFLMEQSLVGSNIPDVASGRVDVSVAESGISLMLQLAPLLASNAEKESEILSKYDHMLFDIATKWFAAYEGFGAGATCDVSSVVGDPMPVNRQAEIAEALDLFNNGLITIEMAQEKLARLGWKFPEGAAALVVQQAQQIAEAKNGDVFGNRVREELENALPQTGNSGGGGTPEPAPAGTVVGVG